MFSFPKTFCIMTLIYNSGLYTCLSCVYLPNLCVILTYYWWKQSGNEDEEPEPEYTPAGRAHKEK